MKSLTRGFPFLLALTMLVGCADLTQAGNPDSKEDGFQNSNSSKAEVSTTAPTTKENPIDKSDLSYYQSDAYKTECPVRNDLVWYTDIEYMDAYGIGVFPFWLCEGTPWGGQRLFVVSSDVWNWENLEGKTPSEQYLADFGRYLTDHKFVAKVYICGVADAMDEDTYPGDRYNADALGITDDATRTAVLKQEEDHFESLGYEVIRNHSVNHDIYGDFILVALTLPEAIQLDAKKTDDNYFDFSFNTRIENEMYVLTIPVYSELGMYEE